MADAKEIMSALSIDSVAASELMYETGWTDGPPVVPPTKARVKEFTGYLQRSPDELIGEIPPLGGKATVERIAVNAVMAGCLPEHMPVVITAIQAMMDERFNLWGVQCSTGIHCPLVMVNGPIAKELNINAALAGHKLAQSNNSNPTAAAATTET